MAVHHEEKGTVEDADAPFVRQARQGDQGAFAQLVRRHQRYVFNLAFRLLGDYGVDTLMPHQADDFLNPAGSEYGVWATSNRDVALTFALGAVPDKTGAVIRVMRPQDLNPVKMVFFQGHPNFGGKGYLYTVSSQGFEHVEGEIWICRNPVTPVETLEINVDDYLHLFRYATEEEKREIERFA